MELRDQHLTTVLLFRNLMRDLAVSRGESVREVVMVCRHGAGFAELRETVEALVELCEAPDPWAVPPGPGAGDDGGSILTAPLTQLEVAYIRLSFRSGPTWPEFSARFPELVCALAALPDETLFRQSGPTIRLRYAEARQEAKDFSALAAAGEPD